MSTKTSPRSPRRNQDVSRRAEDITRHEADRQFREQVMSGHVPDYFRLCHEIYNETARELVGRSQEAEVNDDLRLR